MILYDSLIRELKVLTDTVEELPEAGPWPDGGANQMIFRQDAACELGGGTLSALGGTLITSDAALVQEGVFLIGPDIPVLSGDVPYARVAIVQVREDAMGRRSARRSTPVTMCHQKASSRVFLPEPKEKLSELAARLRKQA